MRYCIITFHSVHDALFFEKTLKKEDLEPEMIPVPREISSSCGIAARFATEKQEEFEKTIQAKQLKIDQIFILEDKNNKKTILHLLN